MMEGDTGSVTTKEKTMMQGNLEIGAEVALAVGVPVSHRVITSRQVEAAPWAKASVSVATPTQSPWQPLAVPAPLYIPGTPPPYREPQQPPQADPYCEEDSEIAYLRSTPPRVLVLGKVHSDCARLASAIAKATDYLCVEPDSIAAEEFESRKGTTGLLRTGAATSSLLLLQFMMSRLSSAEARHRGFVLAGLPFIDESVPVKWQLEQIFSIPLCPNILIYVVCSDDEIMCKRQDACYDPYSGHSTYRSILKAAKKAYVTSSRQRGKTVYSDQVYAQLRQERQHITPGHMTHLVRVPQDMKPYIKDYLQEYKCNVTPVIEQFTTKFNPENVIRVDGRTSFAHMLQVVMNRLEVLSISRAFIVKALKSAEKNVDIGEEEDEDIDEIGDDMEEEVGPAEEEEEEETDTAEMYNRMNKVGAIASQFRWKLSHWGTWCPLSLKEGSGVQGKEKYSVRFLDKIYFLSSKEKMQLFIKNPRSYLLPPNPEPPCKFVVVGPPLSGKTIAATFLAHVFGGKVIKMNSLKESLTTQKHQNLINDTRKKVLEEECEKIEMEEETERNAEIDEWKEKINEELSALVQEHGQDLEKAHAENPEEIGEETDERGEEVTEPVEEVSELYDTSVGQLSIQRCLELIENPDLLIDLLPEELQKHEIDMEERYNTNTSIKEAVDEAVASAEEMEISLTTEDIVLSITQAIKDASYLAGEEIVSNIAQRVQEIIGDTSVTEDNYGFTRTRGWVFDDFPLDPAVWEGLKAANCLPEVVVCLRDMEENFKFLTEVFEERKSSEFSESDTLELYCNIHTKSRNNTRDCLRGIMKSYTPSLNSITLDMLEKIPSLKNFDDQMTPSKGYERLKQILELRLKETGLLKEEEEGPLKASESDVEFIKNLVEHLSELEEEEESLASVDKLQSSELQTIHESGTTLSIKEGYEEEDEGGEGEEGEIPESGKPDDDTVYLHSVIQWESDWNNLLVNYTFKQNPLEYNISNKPLGDMLTDLARLIEGQYRMKPSLSPVDMEEEEESELDEELGEEEEDMVTTSKVHTGDTGSYCPVAFKDNILRTGNKELSTKYRDKVYYMSSQEAYDKFVERPWMYVPMKNPTSKLPPMRIYIIGVIGSGKASVARKLGYILGIPSGNLLEEIKFLPLDIRKKIDNPDTEEETNEKTVSAENIDMDENVQEEEEDEKPDEDLMDVRTYVMNLDPPPDSLFDTVLKPWWHSEPAASKGFLYSGFPYSANNVDYIRKTGFMPDAFLYLNLTESEVVFKRIFSIYMKMWQEKQDKLKELANKKDAEALEKWEKQKEERKQELYEEYEAKKVPLEQESNISTAAAIDESGDQAPSTTDRKPKEETLTQPSTKKGSEELGEEEEDIEEVIKQKVESEFPEPIFEHTWEPRSEARQRIREAIENWFEMDTANMEALQEFAEEENIPWLEIDASAALEDVVLNSLFVISKFKLRRPAVLEKTFKITMERAEKLLACGYYFYSKFGRVCPVQIYNNKLPIHMYIPQKEKDLLFPVIHRRYIYFLGSSENCEAFIKDPVKYINQECNIHPLPVKLAVIGPPKSGKTTLAERLSREFGVEVITLGQSLRFMLEEFPLSSLSVSVKEQLHAGKTVPTHLLADGAEAATLDPKAVTQGFVLDGFPNTEEQAQFLTQLGIIPYITVVLQCSLSTCENNLEKGSKTVYRQGPLYSVDLLHLKYKEWQSASAANLKWLTYENRCLLVIDAERSKWEIFEQVKEKLFQVMHTYNKYFEGVKKGKALSLEYMSVSTQEFQQRQTDQYHNNCPVCFLNSKIIVQGNISSDRSGLVEYRGFYYWICRIHLSEFFAEPQLYVYPSALKCIPFDVPLAVSVDLSETEQYDKEIFMDGYCIVTYCQNIPERVLVKGSKDFAAVYKDKIYLFANQDCLQKFMKLPTNYCNENVDVIKLNSQEVQTEKFNLQELPNLGFLQQSVADLISQCLLIVGALRPKYPRMNPATSAAVYAGYYLKVNNQNSSEEQRKIFRNGWNRFKKMCTISKWAPDIINKYFSLNRGDL